MLVLNIASKSDDWRARRLSNFSADSFVLDGEKISSVEGFIQGIKFPEGHPTRKQAFQSVGVEARRYRRKAERKLVWWKEKAILYGSSEHRRLIEKAIRAKFAQNNEALKALLATEGMTFTHNLGHSESPNTILPAQVFCDILTGIREEAIRARK